MTVLPNTFPTIASRDAVISTKQSALMNQATVLSSSLSGLERLSTEDQFWDSFARDDAWLENKGLNITRETFPGEHDWTVWRRCIRSFLPRLFRD